MLVLAGDHKGSEGTVKHFNDAKAIVAIKPTHLMVEVKLDKLCRMVPVP